MYLSAPQKDLEPLMSKQKPETDLLATFDQNGFNAGKPVHCACAYTCECVCIYVFDIVIVLVCLLW